MSDLGQNDPTDLSPGKRACIRRWQKIEEAAREVLATEWEDYMVGDDRAVFERLREALNA